MNKVKETFIGLAATFALIAGASAQSYSIDWHTIDGGGGASTGGVYSVSGTIGQPDAGSLTGGTYTLNGGFWGIIAAVQTSGAPLLSITRSNSFAVISWPDTAAGYQLQEGTNLTSNAWVAVAQPASTNAGQISVTVPATLGTRLFRLRSP
jgi:hypothetical protein